MFNNSHKPFFSVEIEINGIYMSVILDYVNSKGIIDATYLLHAHTVHELYYIERGYITLESNGIVNELKTGDIFIIKAKTQHRVLQCSSDIQRFHLRFQFQGTTEEPVKFDNNLHIKPTTYESECYKRLIKDIREFTGGSINKFAFYRLKSNIGILFSYVFEKYTDYCLDNNQDYIESMAQYKKIILYGHIDDFFYDNYGNHVTIDDLANQLKYSRAHTQRILDEYDVGFSERLRDMRMYAAKQFLSKNDFTIAEIALKCGYSTRQSFEAAFKKYTSMTPSKYRANEIQDNKNV